MKRNRTLEKGQEVNGQDGTCGGIYFMKPERRRGRSTDEKDSRDSRDPNSLNLSTTNLDSLI